MIAGDIRGQTKSCIDDIKGWFDGEIILSTWNDQNLSGLPKVSKIIQSDHGPTIDGLKNCTNLLRMIRSRLAGVKESSSEIVLVTRTDNIHKGMIEYQSIVARYPAFMNGYKFSEKMVIPAIGTVNPDHQYWGKPFHISDWWIMGRKDCIVNFYDIEKELKNNIEQHKEHLKSVNILAEQVVFMTVLKKFLGVDLFEEKTLTNNILTANDKDSYSRIISEYWKWLLSNFIVIESNQHKLYHNIKYGWKDWGDENHDQCPKNPYLLKEIYDKKYSEVFS